ncbi:hypothetical protein I4U23_020156 [Adineta vaga]|nr:hypothetical protein I4U23_020156 [Adineta vaga]
MSSSNSYTIELLIKIPIYLHQYVVPILYFIGNLGNILTLYIFLKKSWRKNVSVLYFIICLISNTIFINSTLLGAVFNIGFQINLHNSNTFLCKLFYYTACVTSIYFPIILILASIDRLLISSQNVHTRLYSSKRLAYFLISISTIICTLFYIHIFIKVYIQEIYPTVFVCYYELSSYLNFFVYSALFITVFISLTMITLSIFAFKNVRRIRAIPRQQRRVIRSMTKKDFQLLRCLYVHNIIYIICSIVIIIGIGQSITLNYETSTAMEIAVNTFLNNFGSFLHYIPYCISFFIFSCVSKTFRLELKRCVLNICHRDLTVTVQDEENNQHELVRDKIELQNVISTIDIRNQ